MKMRGIRKFVFLMACLVPLAGTALAQGQASTAGGTSTPDPGLVSALTKQLNITPQQATGGAGALFGLAKNRLSPADFSQVSAAVPGMNGFLKAAPAAAPAQQSASGTSSSKSTAMSSAMGAIPGAGAADAGNQAPGAAGTAGGLMSLAPAFQKLGLSPAMASQFAPVMQNYVASKGGPKVASLLGGAWK